MSAFIEADLCVIGAGSGGLSVAAGAARLGRKVVLVEKGEMGGDCLNTGCVPSKALIAAAERAAVAKSSSAFGVSVTGVEIDFSTVMAHVGRAIAAIAPHDSEERFVGLGVTVLRAPAQFVSDRAIAAGDKEVRARRFVIATGSSPIIPGIAGLDTVDFLTNETVFGLRELPSRLLMIGGGAIGCELAQAFARLGSRVVVAEAGNLLAMEDREAAGLVRASLLNDGVEILEAATVRRASRRDGSVVLEFDGREPLIGSHLLVAAGRHANIDGLGLDKANVAVSDRSVVVDARLRTSNPRIYVVGDAAGGPQYTHLAGDHASTVIRNILFRIGAKRRDAIAPRVLYTDPEIAAVGLNEEEALRRYPDTRIVRWNFDQNDRAQAEGRHEGFAKAFVRRNGSVLGAVIAGKYAGELIHPFAFAMANGVRIGAFARYIAPYPTRGEVVKRLAGSWYEPIVFSQNARRLVRLLSRFS